MARCTSSIKITAASSHSGRTSLRSNKRVSCPRSRKTRDNSCKSSVLPVPGGPNRPTTLGPSSKSFRICVRASHHLVWGMIESMASSAFSRISNIGKYPKTYQMASDIFENRLGRPFPEKPARERQGKVAGRGVSWAWSRLGLGGERWAGGRATVKAFLLAPAVWRASRRGTARRTTASGAAVLLAPSRGPATLLLARRREFATGRRFIPPG